ncbi:MAG: DUF87 domain-containing protein [Candidatus Hodarchaeaceae archaeon]|nr:DUF87 domain-containing protein [Candidatus Hodarchaeaceae archaeon]
MIEKNFVVRVRQKLDMLEETDKNVCYIGRKRGVWQKYGSKAALLIGRLAEKSESGRDKYGQHALLDSISPHVIFICGARGSGKSYTLGVIAEEIALKNPSLAVVIIDTLGVFWSMKYPNKEKSEVEILKGWEFQPRGIQNLYVFIPGGYVDRVPRETYDASFAIKPAELSVEDWCLTFGIDRYSPVGLLMDRAIEKVRNGYAKVVQISGRREIRRVTGKGSNFSIDDLVECIDSDVELTSKKAGFKVDSRRALISRLVAARAWGIFGEGGTDVHEIAREGRINVVDVSFLEENVRALVVGLLARKIMAARIISTRKEAVERLLEGRVIEGLEEIPATWLLVDEAHVFVPAGGKKTAASDSLIEFVKQGRRPGLTAVLATQQPSALSSRVVSQVDMVIIHKLIFEDDIKAAFRRIPTVLPPEFREPAFVKMLPIGIAIIGDKETSRAFVASIRPRLSQHEGREATPQLERPAFMDKRKIWGEVRDVVLARLRGAQGQLVDLAEIEDIIKNVSVKYGVEIPVRSVLMDLKRDGFLDFDEKVAWVPTKMAGVEAAAMEKEIQAIKFSIGRDIVQRAADGDRRKRYGIFGERERLASLEQIYYPLWRALVDYSSKEGKYVNLRIYVDAVTGEVLLLERGKVVRSHGVRELAKLGPGSRKVLFYLARRGRTTSTELAAALKMSQRSIAVRLGELKALGLLNVKEKGGLRSFELSFPPKRLPECLTDGRILSAENLPEPSSVRVEVGRCTVIDDQVDAKKLQKVIGIWEGAEISGHELVYYPYWRATFADGRGNTRNAIYDGLTGKRDVYAEYVLRRRM